jgi:hypothetical protein
MARQLRGRHAACYFICATQGSASKSRISIGSPSKLRVNAPARCLTFQGGYPGTSENMTPCRQQWRSSGYQEAVVVFPCITNVIHKASFFPTLRISRTEFYLKVPWTRPLVFLIKTACRGACGGDRRITTGKEQHYSERKLSLDATLPTTNLTWTGPGSKPRLCGEIPSILEPPPPTAYNRRCWCASNPRADLLHSLNTERVGNGRSN